MGRAMLCKSLIKFSVDEWSSVPSLLFTWGLGNEGVDVMKIMVTSFKRAQACIVPAPNPAAGHHPSMLSLEIP